VVNPEVSKGLGKVVDEAFFDGCLENYVIDIILDVLADLRL
jgi:hypothetical protein